MTNRRTSIYTIRLTTRYDVDLVAHEMREQGYPITDHGDLSVSFRSSDDRTATVIANRVVACVEGDAYLTTGLGIHRRDVEDACLTH